MEQINNDEINISELIAKCLKFLFKNKILITSLFIAFSIIGFLKSRNKLNIGETTYTKEFIGIAPNLSDKILSTILNDVKTVITKGNQEEIAKFSKQLDVTPDVLMTIKEITVKETFKDEWNKQGVNLSITVTNKDNYPKIISGLQSYINANPYVIEKQKEFIEKERNYLKLIDERINDLILKGASLTKSEEVYMMFLLYKEKQGAEFDLNNAKQTFQFVDINAPIIASEPKINSPKLIILEYGLGGIILAIVLGIIPIFIASVKKYL